jgi:N-methylhydantoinase A
MPGALSAVGILLADAVRDFSRTVMLPSNADLESVFLELEERGCAEFRAEQLDGIPLRTVDLRYRGQGYELNVPFRENMLETFHGLHRQRYGFASESREVEIVNVRVRMIAKTEVFDPPKRELQEGDGRQAVTATRSVYFDGDVRTTPIYDRQALRPGDSFPGPAIITEYSSATILPPGNRLRVDALDNLVIEVHS